jgi:hypothetical protein
MRTRVRVAAATFAVAAVISGCDRITEGTVAMTTQAGPSTSVSTPSRPTTSSPRTSTPRTPAPAPAPGDAANVTCEEYATLDDDAQTALIEEILSDQSSVLGPGDAEIAKTLADAVCTFLPDSTVSEILLGGTTPP